MGPSDTWPGSEAARELPGTTGTTPTYTYAMIPGAPPVSVVRVEAGSLDGVDPTHAHSHDFLTVAYFEHGGGSLRLGPKQWAINDGDVFVVAPGEVMGVGSDTRGFAGVAGWGVYFPAEGLGPSAPHALLAWRSHPLLFPFVRGVATGAQRLVVPPAERPAWTRRFTDLDQELSRRADGCHEAVAAHLMLLLVDLARLATDVASDLRFRDEPVLGDVFEAIEQRYAEQLSLKDVAAGLHLTPAYLTTLVRRRTGRTVQAWITERRMAEARRLLVQTDQTVVEIAGHTGYPDPGYFARTFRRAHGTTPLQWRRAGRGPAAP